MNSKINLSSFSLISFQRLTGNLLFVVLFIYSIVYAVERVTYIDSAWLFFQRVNTEAFSSSPERFSAFISEIPLYIAIKLHLPFKVLVYIFSAGYILLFYFVWRICTYKLNNPVASLVILLGLTLGIRELFLFTVTETHQCVVYSALFFALIEFDFKKRNGLKYLLICIMAIIVMFTHPLGIFTLGFILLYYFAQRRNLKDPIIWMVAFIIILVSLVNMLYTVSHITSSPYSALQDHGFALSSIIHSSVLDFLRIHFIHFYWLPELAGLIAIAWLINRREWLKLLILVLSVIVYLVIASKTYSTGDSSIMIERLFLPAIFMINLVLAALIMQQQNLNKWIPMALIIFLLVNGIHYINGGCLMYKKRTAYLDKIVMEGMAQGNDKYFLTDEKADKERILVPWAFGAETIIYSKFKYDRCIAFWINEPACEINSCIITPQVCLPVEELNQSYFHLNAGAYIELK
ncbi:MAG: hypothetical protein ABIQ40_04635 [Bacteroidia bacterium]